MNYGWLHLFSMIFLAFDVSAVLSLNEKETFGAVARATARRWFKLVGALSLVAVIVYLMCR